MTRRATLFKMPIKDGCAKGPLYCNSVKIHLFRYFPNEVSHQLCTGGLPIVPSSLRSQVRTVCPWYPLDSFAVTIRPHTFPQLAVENLHQMGTHCPEEQPASQIKFINVFATSEMTDDELGEKTELSSSCTLPTNTSWVCPCSYKKPQPHERLSLSLLRDVTSFKTFIHGLFHRLSMARGYIQHFIVTV